MSITPIYRSSEASFLKMQPRYAAMASSRPRRINLDLTSIIATTTAAAPRILELRADIARLPDFDLTFVDELEDAALGLEYAHAQVVSQSAHTNELEDLGREAMQTRKLFVQDQRNLATQGLIDASSLRGFSGRAGYRALIADLQLCVANYRMLGSRAEGKTCRTPSDIDRAEALRRRMETLLGERRIGRRTENQWVTLRAYAFTLLCEYYGQARRAVSYLRWEREDADLFAPSLHKGRIKKRRVSAKARPSQPVAAKDVDSTQQLTPTGR